MKNQKKIKHSVIVYFALILSIIFNLPLSARAQNTLDTAFNAGVAESSSNNYVSTVQPDGKILVGGGYVFVNGTPRSFLSRLNSDGTLDTTFNPGGTGPDGDVLEILVLSDGKILIGGSFSNYNGSPARRVARLNADGTLDTSFNSGTGVSGTGRVTAMIIQDDGKYVIAGQSLAGYNGNTSNGIFRVNTDGSFDSSFVSGFATVPNNIEQISIQTDGKILIGGGVAFPLYGGTAVNSALLRVNSTGTLDLAFPTGSTSGIAGIAIQSDGKILIGGAFTEYNGIARNSIARINANGTLDNSFVPPTSLNQNLVEYFAVQSDGKILAAGALNSFNGTNMPVMRLNSDGTQDTSLNSIGDSLGYHVRLQADGKILVTGFFNRLTTGETHNGIMRFNTDGSLDNSFNPSLTGYGLINAMVQQTDGKMIVAGRFRSASGNFSNGIARFNTNGTFDSTFATGTGIHVGVNYFASANSLAVQTDGKILVGGAFGTFNGSAQKTLIRLNTNGSIDPAFNLSGDLNLDLVPNIESIVVQPDGKIIIGGRIFNAATQARGLFRLNADGSVDTAFNGGNTTANSVVNRVLRQADGKLIIVGAFTNYSGTGRNRIARINTDGTLDTTFNPGTGANSTVLDAALQPDGKLIIVGAFTTINGLTQNRIARLNTDGSLDPSFNTGTGADNTINSIAILPTGKLAIGGTFSNYTGVSKNRLARLNADGSADASFNSGFDPNPAFFVRRVFTKFDGKLLVGGTFTAYSGLPRNSLAQLYTPETIGGEQPLLFISNRDGNNEVYKMNVDGTNQQRLTNTSESESNAFWSPDGQKIVFIRQGAANVRQIWTMNTDGTNQVNISGTNTFDTVYRYSPNGQKILFTRSTAVNQSSIWVMNADGSSQTRLTNDANFVDVRTEWSPGGNQISFSRCVAATLICDIYTMNADGSNQVNRTLSFTDNDDLSRWTPDGSKIIFVRGGAASGYLDLHSMNPDGTNIQRLTNTAIPTYSADLIVSPNLNKMMFVRAQQNQLPTHEVYTMNTDGTAELNLTNNAFYDGISAWSPDSAKIAFISRREAALNEIFVMNADGTAPVRLTFNDANDFVTDWRRPAAPPRTAFDYDGDGKADVSVFRDAVGAWYLNRSTQGFTAVGFGQSGDKIVPADYDGDGKTDVAVYRDGNWYSLRSSDGNFTAVAFGINSDIPVPADYDGDGKADQAVYRGGNWYLNRSTAGFSAIAFGIASDIPVAADYDGDGKADTAVYRDGNWYILQSGAGFTAQAFGTGGDKPTPSAFLP